MNNPEQQLLGTLANLLEVTVPKDMPDPKDPSVQLHRGERWPAGDPAAWSPAAIRGYLEAARHGGSENWGPLALACAVLAKQPGAAAAAQSLFEEQKASRGWMGSEVGSRVYWSFHLPLPLLCLRLGIPGLAVEWLALFSFWLRTAWDHGTQRVLWLGQRSAEPGRDQRGLIDELASWWNGDPQFPLPGVNPDSLILYQLRPELDKLRSAQAVNPAWKVATEVEFWIGKDGTAVVVHDEVNHNTPPFLAASTVGGTLQWAPTPPTSRIREQDFGGHCEVASDSVTYTSTQPKVFPTVTLPLPKAGCLTWRLGSGNAYAEVWPPQAAGGPVEAPKPPTAAQAAASSHGCLYAALTVLSRLFS
jgi:hypothetical protein